MSTGRRALFLAIAGLFVCTGAARAQESRPPRLVKAPESSPSSRPEDFLAVIEQARLEALEAYDRAVLNFEDVFRRGGGFRNDHQLAPLYRGLIAESDRLADAVESADFETRIAEMDLLGPEHKAFLGKSVGASYETKDLRLTVEGTQVEGGHVQGVVSFLPSRARRPWHDLVIDLDFTIVSGEFDLYLRYWPDRRYYSIKFNAARGWEPNKPYGLTLRVKGSQVSLKQTEQPENRDSLDVSVSRSGGIGFGVSPGSKVEISKLTVKVLR